MEDKIPLLKRFDIWLFSQLDEFRKTPGYAKLLESYAGLDDDKQKAAKWLLLTSTCLIPLVLVTLMWWHNSKAEKDLAMRIALVERMQQIIAQNGEIGGLINVVASPMALTNESDLTGRLSGTLSGAGIDLAKVRVNNFTSDNVTNELVRAEADFTFDGLSTDQLVSLFTSLLQQERFRIASVQISRNSSTNLLEGNFHGVHFGSVQSQTGEE